MIAGVDELTVLSAPMELVGSAITLLTRTLRLFDEVFVRCQFPSSDNSNLEHKGNNLLFLLQGVPMGEH
jgi:hypothetical protein